MILTNWLLEIKHWVKKSERELVTILIVVLVGTLGFGLGRWSGLTARRQPVRIENPTGDALIPATPVAGADKVLVHPAPISPGLIGAGDWVASRNGEKYYPLGCAGAKRIKPENLISFPTEAAAQAVGYTRTATCK